MATVNATTGVILGVGAGTCNITAEFLGDGSSLDPAVTDSVEITVTTE